MTPLMQKNLFFGLVLILSQTLYAQVTLKTNLIHSLSTERVLAFDLKIEKNGITGFTRLDIRHKEGIGISGLETNSAKVLSSDTLTSLVWEISPTDTTLNLRLKILPINQPGVYPLVFTYRCQKEDVVIDFESHPFVLTVKDTSLPVFLSSSWEKIRSLREPAIPIPAVEAEKVMVKSPAEVEQQVAQLKRDSREAQKVGELEKKRVTAKIDTLQKQLLLLGDTSANAENIEKYWDIKKSLTKAQDELVVAERVLTLAKTLDAQANEIQRISKEQIASATSKSKTSLAQSAAKGSSGTAANSGAGGKTGNLNGASGTGSGSSFPTSNNRSDENTTAASGGAKAPVVAQIAEKGKVFKIQIGSFVAPPDMAVLRRAGDVVVLKENGMFKALSGSFTDLTSATKYKIELSDQFPGCFVVGYLNGQRVQ